MQDLSEIVKIKEAAEADLLNRPGVTAVDVGYKYVGGKRTDEIAIRIHVRVKQDMPPDEQIPPTIRGITTDVLENTFVLPVLKLPATGTGLVTEADVQSYNPLKGGISIGPCQITDGLMTAGTLGAIVLSEITRVPMILSNFHVMAVVRKAPAGSLIVQPSLLEGGKCPWDSAGSLGSALVWETVDCAVAYVTGRSASNEVVEIGLLRETTQAVMGMAARKRGMITGLTYATIDSISGSVSLDYGDDIGVVTLTNQIGLRVDPTRSTILADRGDSGSVVVDEGNKVVGLLFALNFPDKTFGYANHIESVLNFMHAKFINPDSLRESLLLKRIDPGKGLRAIKPPVTSVRSFMGI